MSVARGAGRGLRGVGVAWFFGGWVLDEGDCKQASATAREEAKICDLLFW